MTTEQGQLERLARQAAETVLTTVLNMSPGMRAHFLRMKITDGTPSWAADPAEGGSSGSVASCSPLSSGDMQSCTERSRMLLLGHWLDAVVASDPADAVREWGAMYPTIEDLRGDIAHGVFDLCPQGASRLAVVLAHVAPRLAEPKPVLAAAVTWLFDPDLAQRLAHRGHASVQGGAPWDGCADPLPLRPLLRLAADLGAIDESWLRQRIAGSRHAALLGQLGFAEEPPPREDDIIDHDAAAEILGVAPKTLANWRSAGQLPENCVVPQSGARPRYYRKALVAFRDTRPRRS